MVQFANNNGIRATDKSLWNGGNVKMKEQMEESRLNWDKSFLAWRKMDKRYGFALFSTFILDLEVEGCEKFALKNGYISNWHVTNRVLCFLVKAG